MKRETGYYWISLDGDWQVAHWRGGRVKKWEVIGIEKRYSTAGLKWALDVKKFVTGPRIASPDE